MRILQSGDRYFPSVMIIEKEDTSKENETEYGIKYLSDGGYIQTKSSSIDVFDKRRTLVRHIGFTGNVMPTLYDLVIRGRVVIIVYISSCYIVDLDTGSPIMYKLFGHGPIMFGADHKTFYTLTSGCTIEERTYTGSSYKLANTFDFSIESMDTKKLDFIHNPFDTTILFLKITNDNKLIVYSFDKPEFKILFTINGMDTFKFAMATPSLLHMIGRNEIISYNFVSKEIRRLDHDGRLIFNHSPDGRYALSRFREILESNVFSRIYAPFHDVSSDGSRLVSKVNRRSTSLLSVSKTTVMEVVLKHPLIYPVFTHIPPDKRWTRLMSDGTVETHDTWPLPGYTLDTLEEKKELGSVFAIPVVAWDSRPETCANFEEAKGLYLVRLARMIALAIN